MFPKNIIIVEDEAITQRYLKNILGQYDVTIVGCFDSEAGVMERLGESDCDMILMDINIKGSVDGLQLADRLLQKHTVPIVFITAHSDSTTLEEALDLSPYGFITKPFSAKDVEVTLKVAYKRFLIDEKREEKRPKEPEVDEITISEHYRYSFLHSTLYRDDAPVRLSLKQTRLIEILCTNINYPIAYNRLIVSVWGAEIVSNSSLRTLVYAIRKLLPDLPLVSHSKLGYTIEERHT